VILNVKQAYYTMLGAQQNLVVKKDILDKQNALLAQINATYKEQQASLVDLKTAQLNAQSAQVDVDSAQNDLRAARMSLAILMGMPTDQDFGVEAAPDPTATAATLQDAIAAGLSQRMEIKQIELSIKSSAIDLALARGQATPTISVSAGVNWLLDWNGNNAATANAGVKLGMPILDAGAVKNQVESILSQQQVYATQEAQTRKSITLAIQNAWEAVALSKERLNLAGLSAQTAELQYQLTVAQRDQGTASNQDVFTGSVNQATAETALAAARNAVQLAELQLQNAMGY
jgi:outer membrane protein